MQASPPINEAARRLITPRSRGKQRRGANIEAEIHLSNLERKLRLAQSELAKAHLRLHQARSEAEGRVKGDSAAAFSLSQAKLQHLQAQLAEMRCTSQS